LVRTAPAGTDQCPTKDPIHEAHVPTHAFAALGPLCSQRSAGPRRPRQRGVGGTAGIHVFSDTNELGVSDVANANSQRNSALFGVRVGAFFGDMIGVEGELGVVPERAARAGVRHLEPDVSRPRGRAVPRQGPDDKMVPFVLLGAGAFSVVDSQNTDVIYEDTDELIYAGVGAKYRVDNGWGLRADARILFPPSSEDDGFTTDFELLLSIYKEFGRKTVEKVIEAPRRISIRTRTRSSAMRTVPQEPEDRDSSRTTTGCPDPDNDQDGIADAADKPLGAEDMDSFQDDDGCPIPITTATAYPMPGQVPARARGQGRLPGDDRLPGSDTTATACRTRPDKCARIPKPERLPGRRRLPRRDSGEAQGVHRRDPGITSRCRRLDLQPTSSKQLDKAVADAQGVRGISA